MRKDILDVLICTFKMSFLVYNIYFFTKVK